MTEPQDPQPNYPSYPAATPTPPDAAPAPPTPPGYGQPSNYGQPANYGQPGAVQPVGGRPGTVLAAGLITIILSALTLLSSIGIFAAISDVTDSVQDYIRDHPADFNVNASDLPTDSDIKSAMTGVAVIFIIVGVIGLVLGLLTILGKNWARIALIVTSALTILPALAASLGLVGLPWLVGSITVLVLLLTGKAKAWFAAPRTA